MLKRDNFDEIMLSKNKVRKIVTIQALRGVACLLVLFTHIMEMEKKYGYGNRFLNDFWKIGVSGVDIFFIISGIVLTMTYQGLFQKPGNTASFCYKRITRIYPLYWFYSAIALGIFLIRPEMINSAYGNQVNILRSFLLFPQTRPPLVMVAYTLTHEIYFYFVFMLFLVGAEKHMPFFLGVWAAFGISGRMFIQEFCDITQVPSLNLIFHPLNLEFISGCAIAIILFRRGKAQFAKTAIIAGFFWLAIGGAWFLSVKGEITFPHGYERLFLLGGSFSLIIYGGVCLELKGHNPLPKFLEKIGKISYSIYLSHIFVLSLIGKIWFIFGIKSMLGNAFLILLMTVSALISGMISYKLIEQPLLRLFKKIPPPRCVATYGVNFTR